jgi:hypothetical protein
MMTPHLKTTTLDLTPSLVIDDKRCHCVAQNEQILELNGTGVDKARSLCPKI